MREFSNLNEHLEVLNQFKAAIGEPREIDPEYKGETESKKEGQAHHMREAEQEPLAAFRLFTKNDNKLIDRVVL